MDTAIGRGLTSAFAPENPNRTVKDSYCKPYGRSDDLSATERGKVLELIKSVEPRSRIVGILEAYGINEEEIGD